MGPAADDLCDQFLIHRLLDHEIAVLHLLRFLDPFFQTRNRIVLQLCRKLIIRIVLCLGQLEFCHFKIFPVFLELIEGFLFTLPLIGQLCLLFFQVSKIPFNLVTALFRTLVFFLIQRL